MRHFHQMIVYHIGKVISGQLVGTLVEHLVVEHIRFVMHFSTNHIVNFDQLIGIDFETNSINIASFQTGLHFFGTQAQRVVHLHTGMRIVLEISIFSTFGIEFGGRIESIVSLAFGQKFVHVTLVDITTFRLTIRSVISTETYAFIKFDAQPGKTFHNVVFCAGHKTFAVGVFDTKYHIATQILGKEIII